MMPPKPNTRLRLSEFKDKYAGKECWIIGRGPTAFDYNDLSQVTDPVGFINDAVQLDSLLPKETPSFFFALDMLQKAHIKSGMRSIPVISNQGPLTDACDKHLVPSVVGHQLHGHPDPARKQHIASSNWLYVNAGGGTISMAINFFWICGCAAVNFVGCSGKNYFVCQSHPERRYENRGDRCLVCQGKVNAVWYDPRLKNISMSRPGGRYAKFREHQDRQLTNLGMRGVYHEEKLSAIDA